MDVCAPVFLGLFLGVAGVALVALVAACRRFRGGDAPISWPLALGLATVGCGASAVIVGIALGVSWLMGAGMALLFAGLLLTSLVASGAAAACCG